MENFRPVKIEAIPKTGLKASQEKAIKKQLLEGIPKIEEILDYVWPKKANLQMGKQKPNHIIYFIDEQPCFVQLKEGVIIPHLKLLHQYPFLLPKCQVDKGGLKAMLTGANVMVPGLLNKGGILPEGEIPHNIVSVYIEGKENAISIGQMQMSVKEMKEKGTGIGIQTLYYIGDDCWNIK